MPSCKPVQPLRKLCFDNICSHMDSVWCKDYMDNYFGKGDFIYIVGPFDILPGKLTNDIIQYLKQKRLLRQHHLHLLITSNLSKLELTRESGSLGGILRLIGCRCQDSLKELNLAYCSKIPREPVKQCIISLPRLQTLNLSYTDITNDVVKVIGAYCCDLRELNVSNCRRITDDAIICLCMDPYAKEEERFGKCQKLSKLLVQNTAVTDEGIEIVLRTLKFMMCTDYPNVINILEKMHKHSLEQDPKTVRRYPLKYIYGCVSSGLTKESFELVATICPLAIHIYVLDCCQVVPSTLVPLGNLNSIQSLHVVCNTSKSVLPELFRTDIYPLLCVHGENLVHLQLAEVCGINVKLIGERCANLEHFDMIFNSLYSTDNIGSSCEHGRKKLESCSLFQNLKGLRIVCKTQDKADIPVEHLRYLLSSPALEHIYIKDSTNVTDELMKDVLKINKFLNLEHMELENCHSITEEFLRLIFKLKNHVKTVKLWSCNNITRASFMKYRSLSEKKKWDFLLEWT